MATPTRMEGDVHVAGHLSANTMDIPAGTIVNADVGGSADIDATKLEHQFQKNYSQATDANVVAAEKIIHTVYGTTGTIVAFEAGIVTIPDGDRACTVDLHKNGTTVLSAVITLDSGNTTYVVEGGTISSASLADGDVLEVVIAISGSSGTNPQGVFANCVIREDAQ